MAHCTGDGGKPLPGLAPVAMQQGKHVARNIIKLASDGWTEKFEYWDKGMMATIGRNRAVADTGSLRFSGWPAWMAWLLIHLLFLVGFRNKFFVLLNWAWQYLTFGRGARLITNVQPAKRPEKS
jgi:NADH dehydrogenase